MTAEQCATCKYNYPEHPEPAKRCLWPASRNGDWCVHHATKRGYKKPRPDGQAPEVRPARVQEKGEPPIMPTPQSTQIARPKKRQRHAVTMHLYLDQTEWLEKEARRREDAGEPDASMAAIVRDALDRLMKEG